MSLRVECFQRLRPLENSLKMLTKTLTKTLMKRSYHTPKETMKCLQLNNYANSIAELDTQLVCPRARLAGARISADQALIQVKAASINPMDIAMSQGYGQNALNFVRKHKTPGNEFPLILGRDFSGIVVARGVKMRRYEIGEEVYGVRWVEGQGTHAEYVIVNKHEMAPKPDNIDFIEAASLPYVACTTWSALVSSGAVSKNGPSKRIFIPGGAGGIGSFAAQLCKAYGHDVVTTCATDAVPLLERLELNNIIDYQSETYANDLCDAGPFDVILDTLNEKYIEFFRQLLKPNVSSHYVSLRPSLLADTDQHGLAAGIAAAGGNLVRSTVEQLTSGGRYSWGFFRPNGLVLNNINHFIEDGSISALIDKTYHINDVLDAYKHVESGHARGKTVVYCD